MKIKQITMFRCLVFGVSLFIIGESAISADLNYQSPVIPKPVKIEMKDGTFILKPNTRILVEAGSPEIMAIGKYLSEKLNIATGYHLSISEVLDKETQQNFILLTTSGVNDSIGEEGYELVVTNESVILRAYKPCGLFRGLQTIRQLLPIDIEYHSVVMRDFDWTIPCLRIEDKPRYQWRGYMTDCGRTFIRKDFLKRYIDLLAYYKINYFHLHLTDDEGWRVEIKKYPRLTEIGAWGIKKDSVKVGGFYTQEDIREIVVYAQSRYVTIIPEIEMPGHAEAALVAYPELACKPNPIKIQPLPTIAHKYNVFCAGKEITFEFLENVLSEVIDLFPSPYIHIGGDERARGNWEKCPNCQKRIQSEVLKNEDELQSYFIRRIEKFLNSKNHRLIGWDEILEGGLSPNATVMSWRGMEGGIESVRKGHDVIMAPWQDCYLNFKHVEISLQKAYLFEPTPSGLTPEEKNHVIGVEACLWTLYSDLEPQQDIQTFPRLLAFAEVGWSPRKSRSLGNFLQDFSNRIQVHYKILDLMGVNYYKYHETPDYIFPGF